MITCECGNDTFRLFWDGVLRCVCTSCRRVQPVPDRPFTIRMPG